ncbi:MAG TPA: redoxin domain-containing protein [Candidatus Angelobacter sp.]
MLGFSTYNYEHFNREVLEGVGQGGFPGPEPGQWAPDFKATTLDGQSIRLSEYRGQKNVLLVFGSATCPMAAGSIRGMNELYDELRGKDIEFLFVYVREAHPGERIRAHRSFAQKMRAARMMRDEEEIDMPMVVDDVRGFIHRKYSSLPNPAFLIDKSGRVAYRCMWAQPEKLGKAMEELLESQHGRGTDHAVVDGGQDLTMPVTYGALVSYRALERGGKQAIIDFRRTFGIPGGVALADSRMAKSIMENPGRVLAIAAVTAAVLAGGLYAGFELRKRRLGVRRNPYRAYEDEEVRDTETGTDYGAVGI